MLENDLNFMKKIEYLLYDKVCVKQRRDFNNYNGKYVDNTCCSDHKSLILLFFHFWMSNWICSFGFGLHSRKIIKRGEAEYFGQKWIVFFPLFKTEIIYILLAWTDFFFSIAFPFFSFHLAFEIRSFSFLSFSIFLCFVPIKQNTILLCILSYMSILTILGTKKRLFKKLRFDFCLERHCSLDFHFLIIFTFFFAFFIFFSFF